MPHSARFRVKCPKVENKTNVKPVVRVSDAFEEFRKSIREQYPQEGSPDLGSANWTQSSKLFFLVPKHGKLDSKCLLWSFPETMSTG